MSLPSRYLTIRNLFVTGNILLLIVFLAALAKDHCREWKKYQREYYARDAARSGGTPRRSLEIRQILLEEGRADRCLTCHVGMDPDVNPSQRTPDADHPHRAAGDAIHKAHPAERFGCTVCHGGRGRATTVEAAHGSVSGDWEKLLLFRAALLNSCEKCHSREGMKRGEKE